MDLKYETQVITEHYNHINNGGVTLSIKFDQCNEEGGGNIYLELSNCFYGYVENSCKVNNVTPGMLRKFAEVLMVAANKIDKNDLGQV